MGDCDPVVGTSVPIVETFSDVVFDAFGRAQRIMISPTAVTVNVEAPDGTISNPTATEQSEGVWSFEIPVDQEGYWRWTVETTGVPTVSRNGGLYAIAKSVP